MINCKEVIIMDFKEGFKERFNSLRAERNLTLDELAEQLNCSKSSLSQLANGKTKLNDEWLTILSNYFSVSKSYLLGESSFRVTDEEFPPDMTEIMRFIVAQNISADEIREALIFLQKLRDKYQK